MSQNIKCCFCQMMPSDQVCANNFKKITGKLATNEWIYACSHCWHKHIKKQINLIIPHVISYYAQFGVAITHPLSWDRDVWDDPSPHNIKHYLQLLIDELNRIS